MKTLCMSFALWMVMSPLAAQQPGTLSPGRRVRVSAPAQGMEAMVGTVVLDTAGVLALRPDGRNRGIVTVRHDSIASLEVSWGRHRQTLKGGLVGLAAGAGAGIFLGLASGDDTCGSGEWCILTLTAEDKALMGGAVLGVLGGVVGLIIGADRVSDRWVPASMEDRALPEVSVTPTVRGSGVGLRLALAVKVP